MGFRRYKRISRYCQLAYALSISTMLISQANTVTLSGNGAPTGHCVFIMQYVNNLNGDHYVCDPSVANGTWTKQQSAGSGQVVPSGSIILIDGTVLSSCPVNYTEVSSLNGVSLRGTVAANMDVGTAVGSDTATPTVNSLTAAAQTFTGSSATSSAVSAGTPAGTNSVPSLTMNSYTPAGTNGSVAFTPTGTVAWPTAPTNVPTLAMDSYTPTGTNGAITITGSTATENAHTHSVTSNVAQNVFTNPTIAWPANPPTAAGDAATSATGSSGAVKPTANHTHTISWPANVPVASGGSVSLTNNAVTSGAGSAHSHTVGTLAGSANSFTGNAAVLTGTLSWPAKVPAFTGGAGTVTAQTFTGNAAVLTGSVTAPTFTGSALGTHTHTLTAVGTNGTSAVTGTLNSVSTIPSSIRVIFCRAN